jgi:hypothetical protein
MKANRIRKPVANAARSAGLARWARKLLSGGAWLMSIWRLGGVRSTLNHTRIAPEKFKAAKT